MTKKEIQRAKTARKAKRRTNTKNMKNYGTYFVTPWKIMRIEHLRVYPECRVCYDENPSNHVHHLRYRGSVANGNAGTFERPGDLVTLCKFHHDALHAQHKKQGGDLAKFTIEYIKKELIASSYTDEELYQY